MRGDNLTHVRVGDHLYLRNANENSRDPGFRPPMITVTKVGPKRIGYQWYNRVAYARRTDGRVDDWTWLQTPEAYEDGRTRIDLFRRLAACGLEPKLGWGNSIPTAKLRAVVELMES